LHAFTAQMRELFGIERITLNEPYLPFLLVRAELLYLRRLARLDARLQATKSYAAYEWNGLEYKADDTGTSDDDVASAIRAETNRASIEAKQDLDAARQQAFGVTQYQWHGGSCSICAPYDGQICTWGVGMQPGGVHPNCQCSGSPVADGAGESKPPGISGSDIADAALLLASLIPAVRAGRIGIAAVRGLGAVGRRVIGGMRRTTETPKDVLNPSGKPIGRPGRRSEAREMDGGEKGAKELYDKLSKGGIPETPKGYPGKGTRLPNGDWVGHRPISKSGPPTVDVNVNGVPFDKIKFP
jgi:hypothetical protein